MRKAQISRTVELAMMIYEPSVTAIGAEKAATVWTTVIPSSATFVQLQLQ